MKHLNIALIGQPNCGKSTIFNLFSPIKQHIANYPGITVDKKSTQFAYKDYMLEIVDLPGLYSFTSYSEEESVALNELKAGKIDAIINIIDASNLKKSLYLTLQLLELEIPTILCFNMMDVAKDFGYTFDIEGLQKAFNIPIVTSIGYQNDTKEKILENIIALIESKSFNPNTYKADKTLSDIEVATKRYDFIEAKCSNKIIKYETKQKDFTKFIDTIALNKFLALPLMLLVIYLLYDLSIVRGYELTNYTWPLLASFKQFVVDLLPVSTLTSSPLIREFGIWMVNSVLALLNYIPIFIILFAIIAIIEDSGYMARMAFILDRVFRSYGLHGQSILPYVLGGVFVGGCAVPAIMATKGIADKRAKIATILTIPFLNCLAKIPFFVLLVSIFFVEDRAFVMFFISTITIMVALIMAKILTLSILKVEKTAPFVLEMPNYHLPRIKNVFLSIKNKIWLYLKKVATIVVAVAAVLFVLIQFPGLSKESAKNYETLAQQGLEKFWNQTQNNTYFDSINTREKVDALLNYEEAYKSKRAQIKTKEALEKLDTQFKQNNAIFYKIIRDRKDKDARTIGNALKSLVYLKKDILKQINLEKIDNSYLGKVGRALESVTQYAGFDWRINVAFLSSFAARESFVATLGALFEGEKSLDNANTAILENSSYTALHALAMILFMALTPPCIATLIVLKSQLNSYRWMLFALIYPMALGLLIASLTYSIGNVFKIDAISLMIGIYALFIMLLIGVGLIKPKPKEIL
ncbi:ferrous iron transporter B [uncultured Helicobacter sp.]|uniref:ferrous iron transporter B n=1 Tax=uncultured Helicobacter sp. TaxID=175537 RepID=UPI0026189C15|nr:ferrous iron transporter B [uncultured Helicobacter sp.]